MRLYLGSALLLATLGCGSDKSSNSGTAGPGEDPGAETPGAGGSGTGTGLDDPLDPNNPDTPYVASPSEARRLSRGELNRTLLSLLGDSENAALSYLPEDAFAPYDNHYPLQLASAALVDSLEQLALDVAARVMGEPTTRDALLVCTPAANDDAACFEQIAQSLLTRAFRRPVETSEVAPYLGLLDFASPVVEEVQNDFNTAVELLVRAVIQDPEFLYRIEVGTPTETPGVVQLTDYEVASRLSYLLSGDMPDATLFAEAAEGSLSTAAGRRAQAERLLSTPEARSQVQRFHSMWLGYRALPHSAELNLAFEQETAALLDRIIFDDQASYEELFTADSTFIDATLAEHYGLTAPSETSWVSYGDSGRAGILSHGSVLSAFNKFSDTSPTQRGIFVRTRLMCDAVLPPPPDVVADQPPGDADAECKTDRYAEHRQNGACAGCHNQLDPIGFGLEQYDRAGRFRQSDDGNAACLLDGQGEVVPYGSFSGPAELAQILLAENEVTDCAVQQLLAFAQGRDLTEKEVEQLLPATTESFESGGHNFQELLLSFVESDAFALKAEPTPTPEEQ